MFAGCATKSTLCITLLDLIFVPWKYGESPLGPITMARWMTAKWTHDLKVPALTAMLIRG
jgi:hypothetical protein